MAAKHTTPPQARCHRCGLPIAAGSALRIPVDHGTSASPDVLWHRVAGDCGPVPYVRRTP